MAPVFWGLVFASLIDMTIRNHTGRRFRIAAGLIAGCCAVTLAATTVTGATPVGESTTDPPAGPVTVDSDNRLRGTPVSVTPVDEMSRANVADYLTAAHLDGARVRSGIRAYRVVYRTVRPDGSRTTASELLAVPDHHRPRLDQAMWLHGTTVYRRSVASMSADGSDRPSTYAIASAGYAVTAPDYLGLGQSTDPHPYMHLASMASASVDGLRASRTVLSRKNFRLSQNVSVTGHSQGGAAVMAVGRQLPRAGFRPKVLAPLSGPFDVGRLVDTAIAGKIANASAYMAYLAVSTNRINHMYPSDSTMFQNPYDKTLPQLIDGEHTEKQVFSALPKTPSELLTKRVVRNIRDRQGAWGTFIAQGDSGCAWRPDTRVALFTARGDHDIPSWNATRCQHQIRNHGGTASVTDVGNVDHSTMALRALPKVIALFDTHRR